jgi:hypothetical protein
MAKKNNANCTIFQEGSRHDLDRMVVGFTTSKCINDQTLGSDTEFCRTFVWQMSDQIVRQMSDQILPGRSESLHSQIVKS